MPSNRLFVKLFRINSKSAENTSLTGSLAHPQKARIIPAGARDFTHLMTLNDMATQKISKIIAFGYSVAPLFVLSNVLVEALCRVNC